MRVKINGTERAVPSSFDQCVVSFRSNVETFAPMDEPSSPIYRVICNRNKERCAPEERWTM